MRYIVLSDLPSHSVHRTHQPNSSPVLTSILDTFYQEMGRCLSMTRFCRSEPSLHVQSDDSTELGRIEAIVCIGNDCRQALEFSS